MTLRKDYAVKGQQLEQLAEQRIIILDGAFGTMLQQLELKEEDFRGAEFASHKVNLRGCNDVLCLTLSAAVLDIHRQYLAAGADIIETNSFNANAISLADYDLADRVRDINIAAARLARQAVDDYAAATGRDAYVAGSVGPTNKSLTMAVTLGETIGWEDMAAAYKEQIEALVEGGVDLLIIETIFDTLNAKAAIYAAETVFEAIGYRLPVILSVTLTESGRTLSGQSLEAFVATVAHARPFAVGLNCGFGIEGMVPHIAALQGIAPRVSVYANAGLPDKLGRYTETPEMMSAALTPMLRDGKLNIIGGCCGTTPAHIEAMAEVAAQYAPRRYHTPSQELILAGLDTLPVTTETNFVNVGERCNVAGSRKFLRLIKEQNYDEALEIARTQTLKGAQIVDVNMDDGLLDAPQCMAHFVRLTQVDPDIARVPLMVDSSDWRTVLAGLHCIQGKPVVNSISLKNGEEAFLAQAREIARHGAAMVVMAFDETGQATTFERKIEICERSYRLLTEKADIAPSDIIFDPNVLAIATGMPEHDRYAVDFIKATRYIKANLPGAKVSGGLSNLSFSFRGNNAVREAMHAIFLSHAIPAGMDMAIVNAAALPSPEDIPHELYTRAEEVILARDTGAAERLVELAQRMLDEKNAAKNGEMSQNVAQADSKPADPIEALVAQVSRGVTSGLDALVEAAHQALHSAVAVINGPLMEAMNLVGRRFGEGRIFLPQVVKSAAAMKCAVDYLTPAIEAEKSAEDDNTDAKSARRHKIVIATVKGDVHDIGKNIVGVIMRCNGFEVIDLGVMVPPEMIVERAVAEKADLIGLSGLITPSLEEMCNVARLMAATGLTMPLFIGGATTSDLHTALRIAPLYSAPVVHTADAASMPGRVMQFLDKETADVAVTELNDYQQRLRKGSDAAPVLLSIEDARRRKPEVDFSAECKASQFENIYEWNIDELRPLINWRAFLAAWKIDASLAEVAAVGGCDHCRAQWLAALPQEKRLKGSEAMQLIKEADNVLEILATKGMVVRAKVLSLRAASVDDNRIVIEMLDGEWYEVPTLRQQTDDEGKPRVALCDFIKPIAANGAIEGKIALFAVTTGVDLQQQIDKVAAVDEYRGLIYRTIADRLAEAATEATHRRFYNISGVLAEASAKDDASIAVMPASLPLPEGIRPAVGYPSLPDQSMMFVLDEMLKFSEIGLCATETGALSPAASTAGFIITHPQSHYFVLGQIGDDQRASYLDSHPLVGKVQNLERFLPC